MKAPIAFAVPLAALLLQAAPAAFSAPADPAALRAIAVAEDERAWDDGVLKGFLADPSPVLRARAALAVGRLQDSTSAPALVPLLRDPDPGVRREAAFALGQIGWKGARIALEAALGDGDPGTVELAIEALGKLGERASTAKVMPFLDADRPAQREAAAVALWRLADSSAAGPLLDHLSVPDAALRWRIVYALERLAPPGRIAPAVEPLLRDPDALVRAHAARTLGRLKARGAVGPLLAVCRSDGGAVVVNALRALASIADSSNGAQLAVIARRLSDADPSVRVTAATVMADGFPWTPATKEAADDARLALRRGLADRDPATRGACGRALVARFGRAGAASARKLLADSSVYARVAVLDGFRRRGEPALAADVLPASIRGDRPLLERMTAAEIAGELGGRDPAGPLAPMLPVLREGVGAPDLLWAASCAAALGEWGDTASVARLADTYAARAGDGEPDARLAIRDALRALAGRAFADSVEAAHRAREAPRGHPGDFGTAPPERRAIVHTSAGDMEWALEAEAAPQTVRNFVSLARRGWFDGTVVHRVVPDFVIQDGDPTGTGSGGPGYTIRCEYNHLRYEAGRVGMALSGKDTGGSQWFVTLSPQPHLDGRYTIFARVTKGLDVARRVTQGTRILGVEIPAE